MRFNSRFALGASAFSPHETVETLFHEDLSIEHFRRLTAYRKFWLFYLGKHWSYFRDEGDPTITINYSRRIVDIVNNFTFKRGFKSTIPDDPSTPTNEQEDREFVRNMLEETWRRNQRDLWSIESSQMGSVTGDVFCRAAWEPADPLEDPYARIDVIPSHLCFPEFGGPHGVDRKKLIRLLILSPVYRELKTGPVSGPFVMVRTKTRPAFQLDIHGEQWKAAVYDPRTGDLKEKSTVQRFINKEEVSRPEENVLGEIPVVHISNYPLAGEFYGLSDLVDAVELNRELNEKITDISDIINYHASPVTVLIGAKLKDLKKGANRVWGLPEGADVKNLELTGELEAAVNHWKMLKESLLEMTGVPEIAMGKVQTTNDVTGVALQIQYMPMMEKRNIKTLTYGHGIRLLNRLIMKITALKDSSFGAKFDKLGGNKYRNDVVFADPMPYDEAAELEKARARIDLALSSRRLELEKMGKSQGEIDSILDEVRKEQEEEASLMFQSGPPGPSVTGKGKVQNMRGGIPAVRAQKVSQTAGKAGAPTTPPA